MDIRIDLPSVKLAIVEADKVNVAPADESLAREMEEFCKRLQREHTPESVAAMEAVRAVRTMFHAWGIDPSRYRPSSEALLRRVAQGKGLYRISNIVDASNLGSIETGWPYGCYDRARITPPIAFRHGAQGEKYKGIGKQTWHLEGRPVLADTAGPFGSPISDSTRTIVTPETRELLAAIYAPASAPDEALRRAVKIFEERLVRSAGACATRSDIITASLE